MPVSPITASPPCPHPRRAAAPRRCSPSTSPATPSTEIRALESLAAFPSLHRALSRGEPDMSRQRVQSHSPRSPAETARARRETSRASTRPRRPRGRRGRGRGRRCRRGRRGRVDVGFDGDDGSSRRRTQHRAGSSANASDHTPARDRGRYRRRGGRGERRGRGRGRGRGRRRRRARTRPDCVLGPRPSEGHVGDDRDDEGGARGRCRGRNHG